ncbi:hypothetical protein CsSME_00048850 [Camellia sinensis var. sinensis]
MGGHDDSGLCEKKSIGVANDVPTFNAENTQNNMKAVYYSTQKLEDLVLLVVVNCLTDTLNNGFMQNIVIAANNTKFAHALVPHLTDK